jgi:hypothetical protein
LPFRISVNRFASRFDLRQEDEVRGIPVVLEAPSCGLGILRPPEGRVMLLGVLSSGVNSEKVPPRGDKLNPSMAEYGGGGSNSMLGRSIHKVSFVFGLYGGGTDIYGGGGPTKPISNCDTSSAATMTHRGMAMCPLRCEEAPGFT